MQGRSAPSKPVDAPRYTSPIPPRATSLSSTRLASILGRDNGRAELEEKPLDGCAIQHQARNREGSGQLSGCRVSDYQGPDQQGTRFTLNALCARSACDLSVLRGGPAPHSAAPLGPVSFEPPPPVAPK